MGGCKGQPFARAAGERSAKRRTRGWAKRGDLDRFQRAACDRLPTTRQRGPVMYMRAAVAGIVVNTHGRLTPRGDSAFRELRGSAKVLLGAGEIPAKQRELVNAAQGTLWR